MFAFGREAIVFDILGGKEGDIASPEVCPRVLSLVKHEDCIGAELLEMFFV